MTRAVRRPRPSRELSRDQNRGQSACGSASEVIEAAARSIATTIANLNIGPFEPSLLEAEDKS